MVFVFLGGAWVAAFSLWRTGRLWMGGRDHSATTAVLYLPSVAGGFVLASALASLGWPDAGQLAFGAALFSWLAIESVLLHRLYTLPEMPAPLRPTLGIQIASPAVGAVAYLNVGGGQPDFVARALIGYALLQFLILARLWPWLRAAGPTPGWWAFSFGLAALPTAAVKLVAHGDRGIMAWLAPLLSAVGTLAIFAIAAMTLVLLARGKLLSK
jgi:tellurite resistance protein